MRVLIKILDGVGLVDIGPVAQTDKDADPQLVLGGPIHKRRPHRAALENKGHTPRVVSRGQEAQSLACGSSRPW